ncbi:MAG: phosphatidylserine decarboxylase [Gammaproteobacteria bacterium]|nr:phosphatidylserine decarboxylase [Gammaproteobacteria bacterium]
MFLQTLSDWLKTLPLYLLPHHLISRQVLKLTRRPSRFTLRAINTFIRLFNVDMNIAANPDPASYSTFNEFFTRELKPDARPVATGADEIASPADGTISAIGAIENNQLFQAKGRYYSLDALLASEPTLVSRFNNGGFTTIYLSPRDYHRLHMPLSGELLSQIHVPGKLFSVAPHTVRSIPNLFARNERVIASFDTEFGLMSLILVGAINVAAIETVWHGLVTPPSTTTVNRWNYNDQASMSFSKGAEMGRFNMGSTIIVLMENQAQWRRDMKPGDSVKMGQFLGKVSSDPSSTV